MIPLAEVKYRLWQLFFPTHPTLKIYLKFKITITKVFNTKIIIAVSIILTFLTLIQIPLFDF